QIAAHVETLIKMMKSGRGEVIEHALDDLRTVRQSLLSLLFRLHSVEDSEQPAAQDGLERIRDAMKYIKKPIIDPETKKPCSRGLHKAQLLLESCVETVVISKLGSFELPVAKRLGKLWQFPSDHPPIAAKLTLGECSLKVASWNVLNRNYYKYIDADTQGLKGSQITTLHEAERRESTIVEKIQEMLLKTNINILCLQECWPELIAELKAALGENLLFEMLCSGDEQDKNQEVIVFDSKLRVMDVPHHPPFSENSKKVVTEVHFQLETESLRVVTTHVPGAPFGCARREFADRLAEIVNGKKLPTVLMADLNFPEKAVHPLLLDRGLEDIYFVPTPYPTNICQGSLLPKRIDSIAVINHQVAGSKLRDITAMGAKELLDGLDKVVELLQSRSAEPLTPTRYHSDKAETDAEKISRLERELHAARQRVKYLQSTIDCQNEERAREAPATSSKERAREALLPHRPTDAPSGHFRRKVQASSVHRVEPEKL
ncbi:unnamed protein product, partial [Cladocopium goreaui]